jgi:putative ABC transport system substrate-binding protein
VLDSSSCARINLAARRALLASLLAFGVVVAPTPGDAQAPREKLQVGILGITPPTPANQEMFQQGLAQLGYSEGSHYGLVQQHADGVPARLPEAAAALVRAKVTVIFARGTAALAAAVRATTTIPIVAVDLESDPIALGYATSLARPGKNVTGVFLDLPELSAKQLQLFREIVPGLSRVVLVGDTVGNAAQFRATERAARTLGVQAQALEGRTTGDLEAALVTAQRNAVGGVVIFSSPVVFNHSARIATLARDKRLATVSLFTEFAEAGGLFTYGPSLRESFLRCGVYVGKILGGATAAELPIERPQKFELVINQKTAKALGLTIPRTMLAQADRVIE